jgi:hypothetical protein
MLIWGCAILIIVAALCRFVPGPKCVTYCAVRKKNYRRFITKMHQFVATDSHGRFMSADFSSMSSKTLIKMYAATTPFGCESLGSNGETLPAEPWVPNARQALKEAIAERLLLEIE